MNVKMKVINKDTMQIVEEYTVPQGSWVQTKAMGAQHASPYLQPTATQEARTTEGTFLLLLEPPESLPVLPSGLLKLVRGGSAQWGRDGCVWLGRNRDCQGGTDLERIMEFVRMERWERKDCPVQLTDEELEILKDL